jgi:hypothetical protein
MRCNALSRNGKRPHPFLIRPFTNSKIAKTVPETLGFAEVALALIRVCAISFWGAIAAVITSSCALDLFPCGFGEES